MASQYLQQLHFVSFRLNLYYVCANLGFGHTFFHVFVFIAKRILLITELLHSVLIFRHHANEEEKRKEKRQEVHTRRPSVFF